MWGARYFGARYFGGRYFGKTGLVVLGAYNGSHFFGKRYFGLRYWGSESNSDPFALTQTAGVALTSTVLASLPSDLLYATSFNFTQTAGVGLNASLSVGSDITFGNNDFSLTPPLDGPVLVGALTVAGDLAFTAPAPGIGRYFGPKYWGPRYWGPRYWGTLRNFNIAQTAGVSLSGAVTAAGGFETTLDIVHINLVGLSGTLGVAGDILAGDLVAGPTPAGRSKRKPKERYIARHKGQDYAFETVEEVEHFLAQTKGEQASIPKRFRAPVKVSLTPEFAEAVEPVADIPKRLQEMPTGAAMAQIRKLEDVLSKATIPTDDEEDEIISWLM